MRETKTPKTLLLLLIVAALAGAVVVAGCGGGGSTSGEATSAEETEAGGAAEEPGEEEEEEEGAAEEPAEEEGAAEEPAEEEAETGGAEAGGGGEAALSAEGKSIFTSSCSSCHTLKAAGATGEVGPNLDELKPPLATVEHQVVNGGGGMPAFGKEGTLNAKEIKAVATYVSAVAGSG